MSLYNPDANAARHERSAHDEPSDNIPAHSGHEDRFNDPELFNEQNNGDLGWLAYVPLPAAPKDEYDEGGEGETSGGWSYTGVD